MLERSSIDNNRKLLYYNELGIEAAANYLADVHETSRHSARLMVQRVIELLRDDEARATE